MNFFINRNFLQLFIWFIFFNHAFSDPYKNLNTDFLEKKKIKQKTSKKISLKNKSSQKTFEDIIKDRLNPTEEDISTDEKLDEWLLKNATTNQHISATCKMGPETDDTAVVNQYGDVDGFENLRVIDASIMPDCIRANTNVTTMMIAERMHDLIAGKWIPDKEN